jgi:hypothetical protein
MFYRVIMKIALLVFIIPLLPCALSAREFRDRLDGACVAGFTAHDSFEIKAGPAKEWGRTYTIRPRGSKKFTLLVSLIKTPGGPGDGAFIRGQVEEQGKKIMEGAVEKSLEIRELKADGAEGYYYRFTDRNPRPDEYLYLMQGQVGRANSLVAFTYLFNHDNDAEFERVMSTVKSASVTCDENRPGGLRRLMISVGDLKGRGALGRELVCKSIQVQYFFLRPDAYSAMMPPLMEKEIQSVERDGEKGSILYFRYSGNIEDMKGFFTGLFYGPDGAPSADHPEEFIISRDLMVIFSFERNSALKTEMKNIVLEKTR